MAAKRIINEEQGERICEALANIAINPYTIDPNATSAQMVSQEQGEKIITQLNAISERVVDRSWAGATDATIVSMVEAADAGEIDLTDYWSVGDERNIKLKSLAAGDYNVFHAAQNATLVLMDTDHYELTTPVASGSKCHFVIGFKNCLSENEPMEDTNTNINGWHNSRGRKCCDAIFNMIPTSLQPIFKQFKVITATRGGSDQGTITTYDQGKLALFAEKEIFGTKTYSSLAEADALSQIEYYTVTANINKSRSWWERSPYYGSATNFCFVSGTGPSSNAASNGATGFAPFGCL